MTATILSLPVEQRLLLDATLRSDLAAFVEKVFACVAPGHGFVPNWHIDAICHGLAQVAAGRIKRLMITMPPRYLKSICASVALPTWLLGRDPTRRIICASYAQGLAVKHANDCRTVMNSDWYQRIFPATKIDPAKNSEDEFITTARGFRLATSVGGVLLGRGGNCLIVDDPIKPTDAMSVAKREAVIEWYRNTLSTRLDNKLIDAIVVIMQRLHVDDLIGYLLEQEGWTHLNLAAIAETDERIAIGPAQYHTRRIGEALHPEREPLDLLARIRSEIGSATFAAQYQQTPVPDGGHMINWDWFKWYDGPAALPFEETVISWDTAMKQTELADYSVATVWGRFCDFYYLLDVVRLKLNYPDLRRKVIEMYHLWNKSTLLIEDAGSGTSLLQDLHAERIPAIAIRPEHDKVVRMAAQSAKIEGGAVFLPRRAPWLDDLRSEILAFPHGTHDDQVDSISQALSYLSRPRLGLGLVAA